MSGGAIIAIVVVVVVLVVVAVLASRIAVRRSAQRYGKRRRRVDGLGIKPLSPEQRTLYSTQWVAAQETFVSNPAQSARTAAALVTAVAAERGYHVADSDELLNDLSVYHGNQVYGYRNALSTTENAGDTATEQLRRAMLDFRAMFCELAEIGDGDETIAAAGTTAAVVAKADGAPAAQDTGAAPEAT